MAAMLAPVVSGLACGVLAPARCRRSEYASVAPALTLGTSMYATALYDEATRRGLVLGFLQHDLFKCAPSLAHRCHTRPHIRDS